MAKVKLHDMAGKVVGDIELKDAIFGAEYKENLIHQIYVGLLANRHHGTHDTKGKGEIRGGGRKPWRQKGTGRARAGSIRSPLWAGGGVTFGPRPRDYSISMPKKMRVLALKSALAARAENLVVVQDFDNLKEAKTKQFHQVLKDLGLCDKKVLVVLDYACDACKRVELAARNIENLKVIRSSNLNVKDLLHHDVVLTNARTLEAINDRFKKSTEEGAPEKVKAAKAPKAEKAAEPKAEKAPAKEKAAAPKKAAPKKAAAEEGAAKKTTRSTKKDA